MGHARCCSQQVIRMTDWYAVFAFSFVGQLIDHEWPMLFLRCLNAWLLPPCLLAFNSLVAVAYSQWLKVLIIELDALSGALNIIQIPNESPMTFTAYKFIQILHSCKFKICCLGLLFQTVAFRSFRPRTSMNLNRRKSVKIMRRATMTRTCPGWSWSTCSRLGIRHLSCHSWLCFLNNHVIMFVLFVSKHVFTFLCCCGLWNHHAIVLPCVKYCGTQATDAVTETFKSKRILGKARGVVFLCLKAHWSCDGTWTFFYMAWKCMKCSIWSKKSLTVAQWKSSWGISVQGIALLA